MASIWYFAKGRSKSMKVDVKKVKKHWNSVSDSDWYMSLRTDEKILKIQENPAIAFHPAVFELIKKYMGEVSGKYILLPSAGDNHAAFAFAIMGAKVTSADISERQLENAKTISDRIGLDIEFVCDNTMELEHIKDNVFDLVYTSNGTLSWIDDVTGMYKNIHRVLKIRDILLCMMYIRLIDLSLERLGVNLKS